jgi:hypothetical protein
VTENKSTLASFDMTGPERTRSLPLAIPATGRPPDAHSDLRSTRIPRMMHFVEQLSRRFRYMCQCLISSDRGNSWHTRRVNRNRMLFGSISIAV